MSREEDFRLVQEDVPMGHGESFTAYHLVNAEGAVLGSWTIDRHSPSRAPLSRGIVFKEAFRSYSATMKMTFAELLVKKVHLDLGEKINVERSNCYAPESVRLFDKTASSGWTTFI